MNIIVVFFDSLYLDFRLILLEIASANRVRHLTSIWDVEMAQTVSALAILWRLVPQEL